MNPLSGKDPQFASLYFHYTEFATHNRKQTHRSLDDTLLKGIAQMLEKCNCLVKSFVSFRDLILSGKVPPNVDLILYAHDPTKSQHARKYNIPESSEVAALIVGEQHGPLDIILRSKADFNSNGLEKLDEISIGHRLRDPLCYPLLFFDGCSGWPSKLTYVTRKGKRKRFPLRA